MRLTQFRYDLVLAIAGVLMLVLFMAGPIAQPADYHAFADQRPLLGIPHGADVLSNLGFLLAGLYGLATAARAPRTDRAGLAWCVFAIALVLTAGGSTWYHLAPSNARLVWDRLPIALACAALLASAAQDGLDERVRPWWLVGGLCVFGAASVGWWVLTKDLRPYLLVQLAPLLLIPVLQWQAKAPRARRKAFAIAIGLYVLAKLFELGDGQIWQMTGIVSGHTLKHLTAALAAFVLVRARSSALDTP